MVILVKKGIRAGTSKVKIGEDQDISHTNLAVRRAIEGNARIYSDRGIVFMSR